MKVSEIMIGYDDLPLIQQDETMDQAILMLSEKNLGSVLVVDEKENLLGIITDGDLKRHMAPALLQKPVQDIMSTAPKSISVDALATEDLDQMTQVP